VLDVRRLRIFREAARAGSLAGAAEALSYSASAISQQIGVLEREAGMALLERRPRGVVLTEAGRVLLEHVEGILERLDAAEAALADVADVRGGRLRMASFPTAAATVLPPAVDAFRALYPGVALQVGQSTPEESLDLLRDGRLDVALTLDLPPAAAGPGIEVLRLFDDPVRLALRRDHPLAGRAELRLGELAGETWIDVPRSSSAGGNMLTRASARAGFEPDIAYLSDDYAVIRELVGAGVGIALLPGLAQRPLSEAIVLRPLGADAPSRVIQVAARATSYRSPAAAAMVELLLEQTRARREPAQPGATALTPSR
jgi:DNA-binding transcriptional LysR family regulator